MYMDKMGNGGSGPVDEFCTEIASGDIAWYALVSQFTGNDSTGTLGNRTFINISPYRTIEAASDALINALGNNQIQRGQIIILRNPNNPDGNSYTQNGDLVLRRRIFLRGSSDQAGNFSAGLTLNTGGGQLLAVTGNVIFEGANRLDSIIIIADSFTGQRITCTSVTGTVLVARQNRDKTNGTFMNFTDSQISIKDSKIEADGKNLLELNDSLFQLNNCQISNLDSDLCLELNNSKCYMEQCNLKTDCEKFLDANNNSTLEVNSSSITIDGDNVILNDIDRTSNSLYKLSTLDIEGKNVKDVTNGNKVKYDNDLLLGNYLGLLNSKTAEYKVLTDEGVITSTEAKIIRGANKYVITQDDVDIIFKDSGILVIKLPDESYNGRKLTLKFINVKERRLQGRFNKDDVEQLKTLKVLNLEYVDGVWYLM
ncbi:P22 tailspike C-terminal domain-like protein [Orpheovirus IHUMI-LCC2]|uniref:P22 tailspike C-terminal domain-like protein n=1 Tax=Orpheovirus IHUMI-LCC2 TaxID=2023057 RepID=A0A2I2L4I0_9VIRU|nr:P22 tailspike C-terminal domain-like protein [Orpheovirus IHUMI-LCC2]SNW62452.1 P22 tailspike C-terminal domain-like protein [Orpheovirus IHUMI-LCC2]